MEVECRTLRFNLEKELDRRAKDTLYTVPVGQRNQFILNAICAYGEQQSDGERLEQFAQRVTEIVIDALAGIPTVSIGSRNTDYEPDKDTMEKSLEYAEEFLKSWC